MDGRRVRLEQPENGFVDDELDPDVPVWDIENGCVELVPRGDVDALHPALYRTVAIEGKDAE